MNKVELVFGKRKFTAKFGVVSIGRYLKDKGQSIEEMFKEFQSNPFFTGPSLMYHSIKEGTKDLKLTEDEFEDLIDGSGGFNSPQLIQFLKVFGESLTVDNPEAVGKLKTEKAKT